MSLILTQYLSKSPPLSRVLAVLCFKSMYLSHDAFLSDLVMSWYHNRREYRRFRC